MKKSNRNHLLVLLSILFIITTGCMSSTEKKVETMTFKQNQGLVLLAAPSVNNKYYSSIMQDVMKADKEFLDNEGEGDKVIVMADSATDALLQNHIPKARIAVTGYDDIWLRDVGPVVTKRLVKFIYKPVYLESSVADEYDNHFREILDQNSFSYHQSKLILDGGNAIWNGAETVIMTKRVLADNKQYTENKITEMLKKDLKVNTIIYLPEEEGDVLAHSDGMVKFISEKEILISDFNDNQIFRQKVETAIKEKMPDADFIVIPSSYTESQYDSMIASARGVYVNILETINNVYVPMYGFKEDDEILDLVTGLYDKTVIGIDVEKVSVMGGAVNCLTWYCPPEFIPDALKLN